MIRPKDTQDGRLVCTKCYSLWYIRHIITDKAVYVITCDYMTWLHDKITYRRHWYKVYVNKPMVVHVHNKSIELWFRFVVMCTCQTDTVSQPCKMQPTRRICSIPSASILYPVRRMQIHVHTHRQVDLTSMTPGNTSTISIGCAWLRWNTTRARVDFPNCKWCTCQNVSHLRRWVCKQFVYSWWANTEFLLIRDN